MIERHTRDLSPLHALQFIIICTSKLLTASSNSNKPIILTWAQYTYSKNWPLFGMKGMIIYSQDLISCKLLGGSISWSGWTDQESEFPLLIYDRLQAYHETHGNLMRNLYFSHLNYGPHKALLSHANQSASTNREHTWNKDWLMVVKIVRTWTPLKFLDLVEHDISTVS